MHRGIKSTSLTNFGGQQFSNEGTSLAARICRHLVKPVRTLSSAFVILSCLLVVVAAAPPGSDLKATVHVGDGILDGSFLKPYNNAWFYSVKSDDGQVRPQGIWSDHMQWTTANGKQALLRVQGTTFVNGLSNTIINTFDPKTLAPITSEAHGIDGSIFKR